ncbi:transglutaminase family protein [Acetobacter syzygii]|uniref:transglutaminase family protein n=1 Tax=Acetobacter syzygii TaxID=146476 RepID=UPI00156ED39F|nr:transglutaminase family protein [Acetobacter syzygii]NSL92889.1 transglutaminase family protein [Acetobacter syzygii]
MSSHVTLLHKTCYRYDRPVTMGPQTIRLRPIEGGRTPIESYGLQINPTGFHLKWERDLYGNNVACVGFLNQLTHFDIEVSLVADIAFYDPLLQTIQMAGQEDICLDFFAIPACCGQEVKDFLAKYVIKDDGNCLGHLMALNRSIAKQIRYQRRLEPGVWSPEETLRNGAGSCRDSAWLLVNLARYMGHAARFVSGYLIQNAITADGTEVLTADLHAWAQIFIPERGWLGFDTTSGLLTAGSHIPLAVAVKPENAAPVSGLLDCCEATFDVSMHVERLFT